MGPLLHGADIHHATLGLIGLGRIGAEVARRARGFDMRVLYANRSRHEDLERTLGLEYTALDDLLAQSDVVSLHTPLTEETTHLLDARRLGMMKRGAILLNTARGPIIDTDALVVALREDAPRATRWPRRRRAICWRACVANRCPEVSTQRRKATDGQPRRACEPLPSLIEERSRRWRADAMQMPCAAPQYRPE